MRKQQGFTLIELVVVIIILGILAVVAAPKFINLQSDARVSALQGLKGAIQGANSLVYSKAALAGQETASSATNIDIGNGTSTVNVSTIYGYMVATENALESGMDIKLDASTVTDPKADWIVTENSTSTPASLTLKQNGAPANCYITYEQATSTSQPVITVTDSGC
ncbi:MULTISPECIES: type II secretion system protein [Shewanella]|uniref:MSHA pilin protein MshA n=1 Tax=Shewanella fodinae TaxID=552357 RepID=A0A4R2FDA3_9GAMM|nr:MULTISPECIES: prepilin-type N-terminal cleavage/methylation domain-containing protein [Shewanella]MBO1270629.1 prepilin-type N-terminal cleavage/methylation domain-containing protein [Shewanella sp. 4t3-1-2LB]TCN86294.1 MSHA pilin protein MshA [Shewanella fodinae]